MLGLQIDFKSSQKLQPRLNTEQLFTEIIEILMNFRNCEAESRYGERKNCIYQNCKIFAIDSGVLIFRMLSLMLGWFIG